MLVVRFVRGSRLHSNATFFKNSIITVRLAVRRLFLAYRFHDPNQDWLLLALCARKVK